jgi:beta-lactamase regulating signal transducer with metallopeptidase domain
MVQVMVYSGAIALALSLVGLCVERLARRQNVARRHLWLGVMVLSLAWPAMRILLAEPSPATLRPEAVPGVPDAPPWVVDLETPGLFQPVATDALRPVEAAGWSLPSDRTLLLAWGATSLALLLGLIAANLHLRWRASHWPRLRVLEREVLVSESTGPALLGTLRPRIIVPRWFIDEPAARQALVLLHESQHMAARDPLLLRLATLLVVAVPWNLPMWWQLRRLRQAMELDCDARVLRAGARPAEYGALLLAVARRAARVPAGLVALGEPVSALELRIRNLTPQRGSRAGALLAFVLLAGGAAAAATLEAPRLPQRAAEPAAPVAADQAREKSGSAPLASAPDSTAEGRSADALPLLPAPPTSVPSPNRRQAVERAIMENHSELLSGPEREGNAFLSVRIRTDGSIEQSSLRYVEAGDEAGLAAATAGASAARDPNGGQLLLARGTQLASGATVRSQVHANYTMLYPREPMSARNADAASFGGASFTRGDFEKVVAHYLPDAGTPSGAAKGTPWLILSQEGRVIRSGYGGEASMHRGGGDGSGMKLWMGRFRFPGSDKETQMWLMWEGTNQ